VILNENPYPEHDPYEILGVPRDADKKAVARANREKMRDLDRNDPLYQRCQEAKETLSKPRRRMRVDLCTGSTTGWLADLDERFWGRSLDVDLAFTPEIACLFSDLDNPAAADDFIAPKLLQPKLSIVEPLAWDPANDRISNMGA
jgi:hypothetical protein